MRIDNLSIKKLFFQIGVLGSTLFISYPFAQHGQAGAQTRKQPNRQIKPKDSSSFYQIENQRQIEQITNESIVELRKLIQRFAQSQTRGELWLRLAELYVEKSRIEEAKAFDRFDKKVELYEQKKTRARPQVDLSVSQSYNVKAIDLYEKFIRYYPSDPRVDKALFFLGFNYFALGKVQRGTVFYRQLTQNHPNSPYISESNFALGEYHFDREEWKIAQSYYRKVAENELARLYLFSLYKMAWCDYRSSKFEQALKGMERVLYESRVKRDSIGVEGRKQISRVKLATEALNDLIPFYADSNRSYKIAHDYFQQIAPGQVGIRLLEKMTYYYSDTGRKEPARFNFLKLINQSPLSPKAFDYQYRIVNNYVFSKNSKVMQQEMFRWIKNYSKGSRWYEANKSNKKLIQDSYRVRESTLRNYVLQMHENAINSRQEFSQKLALQGYELYVASFKDSPKKDLMYFYYAELLFDLKRYDEASRYYVFVIKNHPKSSYVEPALTNLALVLEKSLPSDKEIEKRVGKTKEFVPFSSEIKRFVVAANTYLKRFPDGEKSLPLKFRLARLHYMHNHYEEALKGFRGIVKQSPKSKMGEYSANVILDIYSRRKDYKGLEKAGKDLLQTGVSPKLGGDIKDLIERSSFKTAQQLEDSKNYLESAKLYEKFALQNPVSQLAAGALFNAAANYQRAGKPLEALSFFNLFSKSKSKKDKKLVGQAEEALAKLYVDLGQYEKAALQYERLLRLYPKKSTVVAWAFNSATIWEGLSRWTKAISGYKAYYLLEKKKEREEAWFSIAEIYRKNNQVNQAIESYKKYLSHSPSSSEKLLSSHYHLAELYKKVRKHELSQKNFKYVVKLGQFFKARKRKYSSEFFGKANFQVNLAHYKKYYSIKVPVSEKEQQSMLSKKIKALENLKKNAKEVMSQQEPYSTISSLVGLGQAHWHMYIYFKKIPVPKELNREQKSEYLKQLNQQTLPYVTASAQYYEKAIEVSRSTKTFNEMTFTALKEISRVKGRESSYYGEKMFKQENIDWANL